MGAFETPVTMQTGAGHKYFFNPANAQSELETTRRLIPRVGNQPAYISGHIMLISKKVISDE